MLCCPDDAVRQAASRAANHAQDGFTLYTPSLISANNSDLYKEPFWFQVFCGQVLWQNKLSGRSICPEYTFETQDAKVDDYLGNQLSLCQTHKDSKRYSSASKSLTAYARIVLSGVPTEHHHDTGFMKSTIDQGTEQMAPTALVVSSHYII